MAADNYTTLAALTAMVGSPLANIADEANAADLSGNAQIAAAIASANAVVEDYIRGRYTLPLAEINKSLTDCASTIALYKWKCATKRADVTQLDQDNYKEAIGYLKDISKGVITLAFPAPDRTAVLATATPIIVGENVRSGSTPERSGASDQVWFDN